MEQAAAVDAAKSAEKAAAEAIRRAAPKPEQDDPIEVEERLGLGLKLELGKLKSLPNPNPDTDPDANPDANPNLRLKPGSLRQLKA